MLSGKATDMAPEASTLTIKPPMRLGSIGVALHWKSRSWLWTVIEHVAGLNLLMIYPRHVEFPNETKIIQNVENHPSNNTKFGCN
jgi:hypothetical protein